MKEFEARRARTLPARAARAAIALVAVALTMWLEWRPPAFAGDEWLRDAFVRLQASVAPEQRLAVVDVDESSLAALGPWPWPRDRLAALVEELLGPYEARGVALDLVMPEPGKPDGDTRLAMLAEHGPLVLPFAFDYNGTLPLRIGQLAGGFPAPQRGDAVAASGYIANHRGLAGARHTANIGLIPDRDGMIRRLPMQTWYEGRRYPTLSLALLECCGGPGGGDRMRGPAGAVGDGAGLRRLPYSRQWEAYTVIPAAALLAREVPKELIAGKLVLIGSSALGLADRVATPLSANTAGLLVHAAALSTLLDQREGTPSNFFLDLPGTSTS